MSEMANGRRCARRFSTVIRTGKRQTVYIHRHSGAKRSCTTFGANSSPPSCHRLMHHAAKKCRSNAAVTHTATDRYWPSDRGRQGQVVQAPFPQCIQDGWPGSATARLPACGDRRRDQRVGARAHSDCRGVEIVPCRPRRSEGRPLNERCGPLLTGVAAGNLISSMLSDLSLMTLNENPENDAGFIAPQSVTRNC
jgi:hypothetical protein